MSSIPPINNTNPSVSAEPIGQGDNSEQPSGVNVFEDILLQANQDQLQSEQAVKNLIEGNADSVQEVVMSVAKAEMSFQLFMEIRNKLIDSYNELMRMQF